MMFFNPQKEKEREYCWWAYAEKEKERNTYLSYNERKFKVLLRLVGVFASHTIDQDSILRVRPQESKFL